MIKIGKIVPTYQNYSLKKPSATRPMQEIDTKYKNKKGTIGLVIVTKSARIDENLKFTEIQNLERSFVTKSRSDSKNENKKGTIGLVMITKIGKNRQQSNANLPKFVMKPRDEPKREKQSQSSDYPLRSQKMNLDNFSKIWYLFFEIFFIG